MALDGCGAWAARWWRALLAELLATALLVSLGVASLLPVKGKPVPLTNPALGFGFLVTALAEAFGGVSGAHMNPAVTLAALVAGRLAPAVAAAYVIAQLVGGVLGAGLLHVLAGGAARLTLAGVTHPTDGVSAGAAAVLEAMLTGLLALACCAVWSAHDPARPDRAAPLKLGLAVAGLVYAGGELTGASLNPARSLGPALIVGDWGDHWVYWVGPLGGAAAAALLHRWVLTPAPGPARPSAPEHLPLHDKPDH